MTPPPPAARTDQLRAIHVPPFLGEKNLFDGEKKEKREKKKIVPKKSGPIFCRGGLRVAGL
jgi:hypothetical protein